MHICIVAGSQDGTQEIEHPLVAREGFKHLHQLDGADVLVVLGSRLHHGLQILPVGAEQVMHALQRGLRGHLPEQVLEELRGHGVGVGQTPLDIGRLRVVLHGPLVQSRLLAQAADVLLVIVGEHAHLEDGLRHLRCVHDVHLQQLGLQVGLLRQVGFQGVEQDRSDLLQLVVLQEHFDNNVDVNQRRLVVQEVLGQGHCRLGVGCHHVAHDHAEIGLVPHLLGVGHRPLHLAGLDETIDGLLVGSGSDVDGETQVGVQGLHDVTQLLRALELVLGQPLLDVLCALLSDHRSDELHGLQSVQLAVLEERGEILQDGGLPTAGLGILELLDRLRRPQRSGLGLRSNTGGTLVVPGSKAPLELGEESLIGAGQPVTLRDAECHLLTVGNVSAAIVDVRHKVLFVHSGCHHLPPLVDKQHPTVPAVRRRNEQRVLAHPVPEQQVRRRGIEQIHEPRLGQHI
mmetsp:Transcript_19922/g.48477  ORF Transcript_19922/g.48477 Transcript_19922/m.48477 type:complete len:458 (+) Transcript_19922:2978-4351(+)